MQIRDVILYNNEMNKPTRERHELIARFGGKCQTCSYDRCLRALQFHHSDKSDKKLWSKDKGGVNPKEVAAYPDRFMLLCANCHFEIHHKEQVEKRLYKDCATCGKQYQVKPCEFDSDRKKYCSKKCLFNSHSIRSKTIEWLAIRLERYTEKTPTCWRYVGYIQKDGAGVMSYSRPNGERSVTTARQIAFWVARGSIVTKDSTRLSVRCGNRLCVRIDKEHIWHSSLENA